MKVNIVDILKTTLLTGVIIGLSSQLGLAKEIKYEDFGYALELKTPDKMIIGEVIVPDDLYQNIYRSDLGDMRVYNEDKQLVSHVIIQSEEEVEKLKKTEPLNFFPLYADKVKSLQQVRSQIKIDQAGVIVNVNGKSSSNTRTKIKGYVVDVSKLKDPLDSIQLDWNWINDKKSGIAKFNILASKDLKSWNRFVKKAVVLELKKDDAVIKQDTVRLSLPKGSKYLYLDWTSLNSKMLLTKVEGKTLKLKPTDTTKWKEVRFSKVKNDTAFFKSYGHFQANQINVTLPQENMVVNAVIKARSDKKSKWTQIYTGLLYRIKDDSGELTNDAINIKRNNYSYWKIEVVNNQGGVNVEDIQLRAGYQSEKILFMASGKAPYRIAYGHSRVLPLETTIESFLDNYDSDEQEKMIAQVTIERPIELAGPKALEPPLLPSNWHEWLVWLIYLFIIIVLGKMVWSIVREMNKSRVAKK